MDSITGKNVYNPDMLWANSEYFRDFLQKRGSVENTIDSYFTPVRHYHSLFCDITVEHLQEYKAWLMKHYKPRTINTRICGVNQYATALQATPTEENMGPTHEENPFFVLPGTLSLLISYKLPSVRYQQKPFLNNVIPKRNCEHLKRCLKRDNNMFWYFVVCSLGATGVRVSELIQIKAEHTQIGCMDLCSKGGKVRRMYFLEKLRGEMLVWLTLCGVQAGFIFTNWRGRQITPRGISSQLKVLVKHYRICPDTVYPHSFRHRFAKSFLTRPSDTSLLAGFMGYESIETTRTYLARSSDEQRVLIDKIVTWQIDEWPHADCIFHRNLV